MRLTLKILLLERKTAGAIQKVARSPRSERFFIREDGMFFALWKRSNSIYWPRTKRLTTTEPTLQLTITTLLCAVFFGGGFVVTGKLTSEQEV